MAEEEYNDIKEQVGEEMEAPAPTAQIRGMRPSIISQKPMLEEAPEEEEPITRFSAPQPMIPNHAVSGRGDVERIEEIAESIINEKWEDLISNVGNIVMWKEKVQTDIRSIKQELIRVEERFENLQKAILGRVEDYNRTISTVGTEMKALEGVLERILQPLVSNIKELSRITEDLKKK